MWTGIDAILIGVADLEDGAARYRRMGFKVQQGGVHPGSGTHGAIAFNNEDCIELVAIRDAAEQQRSRSWGPDLAGFIAAGGGIRFIAVRSDDLAADVAAMRARGVDVGDAVDGSRRLPDGAELRWKAAMLGPGNALPLFFIQHLAPLAERRARMPGARAHPNGVFTLERTYIATRDVRGQAALYARVLGMPAPEPHKGTVIMADMSVFQIGPHGLGVVEPYAPGPAAEALERRGPGPFQALYRTTSMGAAARWMQEHGMPPLARGTRATGEQAMLVPPAEACGAYIGFVGPE